MTDSKKDPKMPPPDDFARTTPNIDVSMDDDLADWEKTQVNKPSDAPADDWGKTVINYNDSAEGDSDEEFGATQYNTNSDPSEPEWGMTQANVNLGREFEGDDSDFDIEPDGATVPYFRLPEAERAKYEKIAPTPTEKAKKEEEEKKKQGGIPIWFWVSAGIMTMFSFAVLVLLGVWFFIIQTSGFTVNVKNAKPGSEIFVDQTRFGTTKPDGTVDLHGLEAGKERIILVRKKGFKDYSKAVKGENGETVPFIAKQVKADQECVTVDVTNVTARENCANTILDNMDSPPNLNDLLRALNLYYINFASGQSSIPRERLPFLKRASTFIKQMPQNVVIEIGGHTDSDGDDRDNQILSEKRAESVRKALEGFGVKESRLVTKGYGEQEPKESNDTEKGKFENRRIAYKAVTK
ncbi:MAG: OmpA family protein [Pyrinomonadaceae bacterium]|nr:OmpA family protein [Pyrinomonadaceae bacterium]